MKKIKLTLHGGFHNAVNVHISARDYECLRDHVATLADVLSDSQLARMNPSLICENGGDWIDRLYRFTQYLLHNHKDLIVTK